MPDSPDIAAYLELHKKRSRIKEALERTLGKDLRSLLRNSGKEIDNIIRRLDPLRISVSDLNDLVKSVIDELNKKVNSNQTAARNQLIGLYKDIQDVLNFDYPIDYRLLPRFQQDNSQLIREQYTIIDRYRSGKMSESTVRRILKKRIAVPIHQADAYIITQLSGFDNESTKTIADLTGLNDALYFGPIGANSRQFCIDHVGKVYNERDIQNMDNGQGLPVIRYCGGYRCMHEWIWGSKDWSGFGKMTG